ncbi:hypothetical protein DUHN55_36630 [Helicobacter pylori]
MVDAVEHVGLEDDDALAGLGGEGGGAGGAEVGEEPTADHRGDEAEEGQDRAGHALQERAHIGDFPWDIRGCPPRWQTIHHPKDP